MPRHPTGRLVLLAVLAAALALAGPPGARADDGRDRALRAFRRAVGAQLSPAELDHLLSRPEVRQAIAEALEAFDPARDTLSVRPTEAGLDLRVVRRAPVRRCVPGPEGRDGVPAEPVCDEVLEVTDDRGLRFDRTLWRPPRRRPAPAPPSPEPPPQPLPSVLREAPPQGHPALDALDGLPPPLARALAGYAALRASLRTRGHWTDPLLATGDLAAPPMDERPARARPPQPTRAEQNLADPFGPGRMQTAVPVPDLLAVGREAAATRDRAIEPPDLACLARWAAADDHPTPPALACFRSVLRTGRLSRDTLYQIARLVGTVAPLPALAAIMEREVRQASAPTSDTTVWATVWLAWVRQHPDRLPDALAALAPAERKPLARHLRRWWGDPQHAALEPTLTRIFEGHFLALYPEAADPRGLPVRRAFADAWLWAVNWLAEVDRRGPAALPEALAALGAPERALVEAILGDAGYARRFPRLAARGQPSP